MFCSSQHSLLCWCMCSGDCRRSAGVVPTSSYFKCHFSDAKLCSRPSPTHSATATIILFQAEPELCEKARPGQARRVGQRTERKRSPLCRAVVLFGDNKLLLKRFTVSAPKREYTRTHIYTAVQTTEYTVCVQQLKSGSR